MRTKMKAWRAGTAKLVKGQNWLISDHLNIPGLAWHTVSRCIISVRSFIFQESCSIHHPSFQCHHLSMGLDACGRSLPPPSCSDHQPCGILSALHTVISVQTVCPGVPPWKQVCFCLDPTSRFSVSQACLAQCSVCSRDSICTHLIPHLHTLKLEFSSRFILKMWVSIKFAHNDNLNDLGVALTDTFC